MHSLLSSRPSKREKRPFLKKGLFFCFTVVLSSRAQVTVVNQKERHSELAGESRRVHPRRPLARARFLGKLGMTFFFIRLLVRGHLFVAYEQQSASSCSHPGFVVVRPGGAGPIIGVFPQSFDFVVAEYNRLLDRTKLPAPNGA